MLLELPLVIDGRFIEGLVDDKKQESKILEYKRSLETDRKELCKDVTAFANAAGGLILYGIEEETDKNGQPTGKPKEVCGLDGISPEKEILRMQQMLQSGVDPHLTPPPHITSHTVKGKQVLAVRIYRSWSSPHMIKNDDSRFWQRVSRSRVSLDAHEIGAAFLATSERKTRIERFLDDRLGKILVNEGPIPMEDKPKAVLHVLPLTVSEKPPVLLGVDLRAKVEEISNGFPHPFGRMNLDGVVYSDIETRPPCRFYVQFFRTGAVEAVTTRMTDPTRGKVFDVIPFQDWALMHLAAALAFLKLCGVQPPVSVFLALLRFKGYVLTADRMPNISKPFDRDDLLFPEQIIEGFGADTKQDLEDTFRLVWESADCSRPRA
jgi:hypothetical protein